MTIRLRNTGWTPLILLSHQKGALWGTLPQSFEILHEYYAFSKLFHLRTSHGVLGNYAQMRCTNGRNHNCECGQLETVEHVIGSVLCSLQSETCWGKFPRRLTPKKGLGVVVILRLLAAASLLTDRLIKPACFAFTVCQSLLLNYQVLFISGFP